MKNNHGEAAKKAAEECYRIYKRAGGVVDRDVVMAMIIQSAIDEAVKPLIESIEYLKKERDTAYDRAYEHAAQEYRDQRGTCH